MIDTCDTCGKDLCLCDYVHVLNGCMYCCEDCMVDDDDAERPNLELIEPEDIGIEADHPIMRCFRCNAKMYALSEDAPRVPCAECLRKILNG